VDLPQFEFQNTILNAISDDDRRQLLPHLRRVALCPKEKLEAAGEAIEYVYFIERGLASVVARLPTDEEIEVGLIGFEGMTGVSLVLGDIQTPFNCYSLMQGAAIRLPYDVLLQAMVSSPALRTTLLAFARAFTLQIAFTALSNGRLSIEQRLARWIIMADDRTEKSCFPATHDFLASILGVRRQGITLALQALVRRHLIQSHRNEVVVVDRDGLAALSGGGYGPAEREYERLTDIVLSKTPLPMHPTPAVMLPDA
jgi:CRP-like cAMP-binding protein